VGNLCVTELEASRELGFETGFEILKLALGVWELKPILETV